MRHDFSLTCHSVQRAGQPLSQRVISFGIFTVAGDFVHAPAHSSRKSWELTVRELTTFILWLINSPCAQTGSNL